MITSREAIERADTYIKTHYGDLGLLSRLLKPLTLPQGWRFVYEAYHQNARVRRGLIILWIPQDGTEPQVEFSEIEDQTHQEFLRNIQKDQWYFAPPQQDVALEEGLRKLNTDSKTLFDRTHVTASEVVVDPTYQTALWRFDLIQQGVYRKVYVRAGPTAREFEVDISLPMRRAAAKNHPLFGRWVTQNARRDLLRFNFRQKESLLDSEQLLKLRGEMLIRLVAHWVQAFLKKLGYTDFLMDERLLIQQNNMSINDELGVAQNSEVWYLQERALLLMPYDEKFSYTDDPCLLLHEFGHVIWYLLYVRPPNLLPITTPNEAQRQAEQTQRERAQHALEEGFCDYLSAVFFELMSGEPFTDATAIGGRLAPHFISAHNTTLPRSFNGRQANIGGSKLPLATELPTWEEQQYVIGLQWANFLWAVRQRIDNHHVADRIITQAHFCPPRTLPVEASPTQAYLASLRRTCAREGVNITPAEWDALEFQHRLR